MKLTETVKATPITAPVTIRRDEQRLITSGHAGKILPLAYVPLLREDRVTRGQYKLKFEMMETAELLANAVHVTAHAWFVPFLAFERFNGMDQLNRAYEGEPDTPDGNDVTPFIETVPFDKNAPIYKTMGLHMPPGMEINSAIVEAYNEVVNYRRKARLKSLTQRLRTDTSLAEAFWYQPQHAHIVPDFEDAAIDGTVPLQIVNPQVSVKGLYNQAGHKTPAPATGVNAQWSATTGQYADLQNPRFVTLDEDAPLPRVFAELEEAGITVSLANIEMAKKMSSFAQLRAQYKGLDDDHIIDLLMDGVRVPEQQLAQPILLDRKSTIFGYNQRYATDAGNLAQSATNGETFLNLQFRTPPMNTGGVIIITCEISPEQMFERQQDYFLTASDVDDLPQFVRDYLDPQKVSVVQNKHVDVMHGDPNTTFGYAPLNHQWKRQSVRIGGKYFRPDTDAVFDEERQKFWANETIDPTYTDDFVLVNNIHNKVFADTVADPFEITVIGGSTLAGHTVFGKGLMEDTEDYDKIMAEVDQTRINSDEE